MADPGQHRSNEQIVAAIDELRSLTALDDGDPRSFRARAYGNAVAVLHEVTVELGSLTEKQLMQLPAVGKATAGKIRELIATGAIRKLESLRASYPPEYQRLSQVPGVTPATLVRLRDELGVRSVSGLSEALASGAIAKLPGLSRAVGPALSRGVALYRQWGADRLFSSMTVAASFSGVAIQST